MRLAFAGVAHWHFSVDAQYLALVRASGAEIVGLSDDDAGELVGRFRPDLVIALPRPDRAPEQVGRLLDRGVPLFVEKPLGLRAADVWPLVERAERGWVTVALPQRYQPIWTKLDELREGGRLGTLGHVGVRGINGPPWRYRAYGVPWMLDPAVAGGGPLRNIGIHLTDALVQLMAADSLRVVGAARMNRMHGEPIEDFIAAIFRTPDDVTATLETGYSFAPPKPGDSEMRIAATGAYLIQRREGLTVFPAEGEPEHIPASGQLLYEELFFDALGRLRRGQPPIATVRDCALANELIDRIYEAAGT
jgi:predicted dehydrogenase